VDADARYWAFLSYSHADRIIAAKLHRALETYRLPARLVGRVGSAGKVPERLHPVFRDREELTATGGIGAAVDSALRSSRALLVLCSPAAAASRWVDAEIVRFAEQHPQAPVLCVLLDGEPLSERECLPPALRRRFLAGSGMDDAAPVAVDLRPEGDGWRLALLKLVAGLAGVPLDQLVQRDAHRRHRRMGWLAAAAFALALAFGTMSLFAMRARDDALAARNDAERRQAQAEDLLGFMLGDLRGKLEKVGRLDLLDSVGDKAMAYFDSLDPRDLNDRTLAWQEQALTQIGQVRLGQARYPEALAAFERAYARSSALAERHSGDGELLFDRGQAEYWIGYVYWQRRDLGNAERWLMRYRDTCRAVYTIDPGRTEWLHELAYGDVNLATLELERGQLAQALAGFERAQSTFAAVQAKAATDPQVAFEIADNLSWRGNVEEQLGHLDRAAVLMAAKVDALGRIVTMQPEDPGWKFEWSNAELVQSAVEDARGQHARAEALADRALARMRGLVAFDPDNKEWRRALLRAYVRRASARVGQGRMAEARTDLAAAQPLVDASAHLESSDRLVRREMLDALTLRGLLALHGGDRRLATATAAQLRDLYRDSEKPQSPEDVGRYASSLLALGQISADTGDGKGAARDFAAAHAALRPLAGESRYWRVLEPWVRAALLTGDTHEAVSAQARLAGEGYVPLFPWPTPAAVDVRGHEPDSRTRTGAAGTGVSTSP
jgi:tetratricopeptide (TPR) repeat protein